MNRTPLLEISLNRLAQLTLPTEILVVDDGGSDGLADMCHRVVIDCPIQYVYTHNPHPSLCSHARNVGIKNTECDIVITTEPEMWFMTDVIAQMLADHSKRPEEVISVGTVHHMQDPRFPHLEDHVTRGWVAPWIALYEKQWLFDVGGWDETFPDNWGWEDTDLLTRLRVSGHGQHIDQEIEARHLWHPPRAIDQVPNEAHFRAKHIDGGAQIIGEHIVANKDSDWGVIKRR